MEDKEMTKKYLVDEDQYSGQMVIICNTEEIEVDTYQPTQDQLDAAIYLYRELPKVMERKTRYEVSGYYHFEEFGADYRNNLFTWITFDKDEANQNFKNAVLFFK